MVKFLLKAISSSKASLKLYEFKITQGLRQFETLYSFGFTKQGSEIEENRASFVTQTTFHFLCIF